MKFDSGCSGCFAGLACDVRIEIVNLLQKNGKMQVGEIAKYFQLKQPTISHHLKYLSEMGVIASKKSGRNVSYYIHPKCLKKCSVFI
jgi:ArsR family transcriptional regulator